MDTGLLVCFVAVCSPQEGHGPSIIVPDLVVTEKHLGRDVTMTVTTDTPNVIWFKDDNVIEGVHGGKKYQIKQVESRNFGRYNCKSISGSSLSLREIEVSVGQWLMSVHAHFVV